MIFKSREQAAFQLVTRLEYYRKRDPLVLAVPPGGVPIGDIIVKSLGGELDLILVERILMPEHPNVNVGSAAESGFWRMEDEAQRLGLEREEIERLARRTIAQMQSRRQSYAPLVKPVEVTDREVILVDDGIVTGTTMMIAVDALQAARPTRMTIAVPVASTQAVSRFSNLVDEVVALQISDSPFAVSHFFEEFSPVKDEEVVHILSESRKQKPFRDAFRRGAGPSALQQDPSLA